MDSEYFTQETYKRFAEFVDSFDWVKATLYNDADTPIDFIVHYEDFEYGYGYDPSFTIKASDVTSQKIFEHLKSKGYVGTDWYVDLDEDGYPNGSNQGVRGIEILANYQEDEENPCLLQIGKFGYGETAEWGETGDLLENVY